MAGKVVPTTANDTAALGLYQPGALRSLDVFSELNTRDLDGSPDFYDKPPLSAPAGWKLLRVDSIAASLRQAIYIKTAGRSEPTAHTWTLPDWRRITGGISTYRGVDLAHRIGAHAGSADATADTKVDAPSVTPTVPGTVLVHFAAARLEGTLAPPALMMERWERGSAISNSPRDALASSSDGLHPGTGPTGIRGAETNVPSIHIGATVVLRPAS